MDVIPPISIKYRWTPDTIPVIIPTQGPNNIPPETTAIILTFTSDPSTLIPEYVPKMANKQNTSVMTTRSVGEC